MAAICNILQSHIEFPFSDHYNWFRDYYHALSYARKGILCKSQVAGGHFEKCCLATIEIELIHGNILESYSGGPKAPEKCSAV